MPDATFACPDLTTFCRLDELGLEVVGQRLEPDRAVLACRVVEPDEWCRRCGCEGSAAGHGGPAAGARAAGLAADDAAGHGPPLPLHRAAGTCGARTPARRPSRGRSCPAAGCGGRWRASCVQHLTVARVAEGLGVPWNTANDAVLAEGSGS